VREAKNQGHDIEQFYQDNMPIDPSMLKEIIRRTIGQEPRALLRAAHY
jgi:hypothetical protein